MTRSYRTPAWLEKENPCKGCADRKVGCQGACQKREAWVAKREEDRERWYVATHQDALCSAFIGQCINQTKKAQNKP